MNYRTYHSFQYEMDLFFQKYRLLSLFIPSEESIKDRIPEAQRICRFCGKRKPDTSFKSDAHIIPRLLQKNYGVSDIECDDCNNKFSKYETHLADFLGLLRTFLSVANENPVPTFKSPRETLIARISEEYGDAKAISISDHSRSGIIINTETGENRITYTKNSYVPINVFKALLKIALTVLPNQYVSSYRMMYDFLATEDNHPAFTQFGHVVSYVTDQRVEQACCYLLEKIDANELLPTHVFKLYFENFIYEFFIPYFTFDLHIYEVGKRLNPLYCPPILIGDRSKEGSCSMEILDLTSTELLKGQEGNIVYKIDPEIYKNAEMYDPVTGEKFPFKPEEIVKINVYRINNI